MKRDKIIYWSVTGLFSAFMLYAGIMYFVQYQMAAEGFKMFNYPVYLVYFLGTAKPLGAIAILTKKSTLLKYLAYAGFFFNFVLAIAAHIAANDGQFGGALFALILLTASYLYDRKLFANK